MSSTPRSPVKGARRISDVKTPEKNRIRPRRGPKSVAGKVEPKQQHGTLNKASLPPTTTVVSQASVVGEGGGEKPKPKSTHRRKKQPQHLPLRRTLIRSSGKKCWEAMSPLVGYQRWRKMQYSMNWRMILLLRGVAKMSLLRLTDPSVKLKGNDVVEIADQDPNPDADVKFMESGAHRVAPDSILHSYDDESAATEGQPWCLLLGCPGHISIGILWPRKGKRKAYVEHFDSRGINESIKAGGGSFLSLPHMKKYFRDTHSINKFKSVNAVDFQEVSDGWGALKERNSSRCSVCPKGIHVIRTGRIMWIVMTGNAQSNEWGAYTCG